MFTLHLVLRDLKTIGMSFVNMKQWIKCRFIDPGLKFQRYSNGYGHNYASHWFCAYSCVWDPTTFEKTSGRWQKALKPGRHRSFSVPLPSHRASDGLKEQPEMILWTFRGLVNHSEGQLHVNFLLSPRKHSSKSYLSPSLCVRLGNWTDVWKLELPWTFQAVENCGAEWVQTQPECCRIYRNITDKEHIQWGLPRQPSEQHHVCSIITVAFKKRMVTLKFHLKG